MSGAMPQHYKYRSVFSGADTPSIFLRGSTLFRPFAESWGIELDQINFLICEMVGIISGSFIRIFLPAENRRNHRYRLLACGLTGFFMAIFCFGLRSLYLWAVTTLCYMISRFADAKYSHLIVFVVSVGYLSYLHIYRMLSDYGGYSLDITMPMMVIVQKITAFAFAVHDGAKPSAQLTKVSDQSRHAIRKVPDYWVFCSYVFCFQSLLCGPFCFLDEYMDFIEGRCVTPSYYKKNDDSKTVKSDAPDVVLPAPQFHPSPVIPVIRKVVTAIILCYIHVTLVPGVPLELLTDKGNIEKLTFIQLMFYLLIATTFVRLKYYVAWLLTDAVANASGLGFNGYDELGKPKWDLVSNVDIIEFEFSQNMREALTAWNSCTARWLRYIAYDRAVYFPMLATYTLSAFWHGFYPGYYVTFLSGAMFTEAARWTRRVFRPPFQKYRSTRLIYDFMTFLTTRIVLAYATFPFVLLELGHAWTIYRALFFWLHILGVLALLVLPRCTMKKEGKTEGQSKSMTGSSNEDVGKPSPSGLPKDLNVLARRPLTDWHVDQTS